MIILYTKEIIIKTKIENKTENIINILLDKTVIIKIIIAPTITGAIIDLTETIVQIISKTEITTEIIITVKINNSETEDRLTITETVSIITIISNVILTNLIQEIVRDKTMVSDNLKWTFLQLLMIKHVLEKKKIIRKMMIKKNYSLNLKWNLSTKRKKIKFR